MAHILVDKGGDKTAEGIVDENGISEGGKRGRALRASAIDS